MVLFGREDAMQVSKKVLKGGALASCSTKMANPLGGCQKWALAMQRLAECEFEFLSVLYELFLL